MRLKLFFILSILIICCSSISIPKNAGRKGTIQLELSGEVGYITKAEGFEILEELKIANIEDQGLSYLKDNDTIGKYIKSKETGNYVICLLDMQEKFDFETHVLIELKLVKGKTFKVLAIERFFHGNYSCCWSNSYSGFNQMDDYFTLDCCGTGSGYCSLNTYYFKNVVPQKTMVSITDNYSSYYEDEYSLLFSTKHLQNDSLTYNYRLEKELNNDSLSNVVDTFSIIYVLKKNKWTSHDEDLKNLGY